MSPTQGKRLCTLPINQTQANERTSLPALLVQTETQSLLPHKFNGNPSRVSRLFWAIFLVVSVLLIGCLFVLYSDQIQLEKQLEATLGKLSRFNLATISTKKAPNPRNDNEDGETIDNLTPNRYTGTQFISFTINTHGGYEEEGECEGRDVEERTGVCYLGNRQNLTEDIAHRLRLLFHVLEILKQDIELESPRIDHRKDILKIFMLPEFYFRGPEGAYPMEMLLDHGILDQAMEEIHHYIADKVFNDYLFVFGTIIAASRWDVNNAPPKRVWDVDPMKENQILYYNFAPVSRGGRAESHNRRYLVCKKTISTIDFLANNSRLPSPIGRHAHQYDAIPAKFRRFWEKTKNTLIIEDNVIHVDGIRIGLEVCLDHRLGLLWESLQKQRQAKAGITVDLSHHNAADLGHPVEEEPDLVDVHLITSAGMRIEYGPVPLAPGGVVYMCDGRATTAACWRSDHNRQSYDPDTLCRIPSPLGLKHFPPLATTTTRQDSSFLPHHTETVYSSFFTVAACQDVLDFDMLRGYFSMYAHQGCTMSLSRYGIKVMDEMKYNLPSIEFYPTVDLPNKGKSAKQRKGGIHL